MCYRVGLTFSIVGGWRLGAKCCNAFGSVHVSIYLYSHDLAFGCVVVSPACAHNYIPQLQAFKIGALHGALVDRERAVAIFDNHNLELQVLAQV
jgi:hypothetical protein